MVDPEYVDASANFVDLMATGTHIEVTLVVRAPDGTKHRFVAHDLYVSPSVERPTDKALLRIEETYERLAGVDSRDLVAPGDTEFDLRLRGRLYGVGEKGETFRITTEEPTDVPA